MVNRPDLLVGVLALQGDVREHVRVLDHLGARSREVRSATDLEDLDGLILPGGESSVIDKLARMLGLAEPLRRAIRDGLPVYGTCAGLILLADRSLNAITGQESFGGLDVTVERNAFGSQVDSFEADLAVPELGETPVHAVFIRAPLIRSVGDGVRVLAALAPDEIVAVQQGNVLATSFHPEVTGDTRFHEYFLDVALQAKAHETVIPES